MFRAVSEVWGLQVSFLALAMAAIRIVSVMPPVFEISG